MSTGARLGLGYDFGAVQHTSTFLAHQVLHLAKVNGRQSVLLELLFSAFFEQGRNLGRVEELVALAGELGLAPAEVRRALTEARYADAVRADRELAGTRGVLNIPTYIIDGQSPIHGAKRPAILTAALRSAAERREAVHD